MLGCSKQEGELLTQVVSDVIYITLTGRERKGRELSILLQTILSMVLTTGLRQTWAFLVVLDLFYPRHCGFSRVDEVLRVN